MRNPKLFQVFGAVATGVLSVLSNVIANVIVSSNWRILLIFLLTGGIIGLVYWLSRPQKVDVTIKSPITIKTEQDRLAYAKSGLIICASLYSPNKGTKAEKLTAVDRLKAAKEENYTLLDLENSNFATAIEAISTHASKLAYCWIITTTSSDGKQSASAPYVPVLVKYLQEVKQVKCKFKYTGYSVTLDNDSEVTVKSRNLVNRIFKEAQKLGLKDKDMIADITGGMRSIPLGIILACLDGRRKIEFIGTHYDKNGRFSGALYPMFFDYEPILSGNS
jgi:hypothetical protein